MKRLFLGLLIVLLAVPPMQGAVASVSPDIARKKINLAGRQRMLSQRMSAASCLAMAGVQVDRRQQVARDVHAEFVLNLNGLRVGSDVLNLPAETNAQILEAFADVAELWTFVGPSVLQLSVGDTHSVVIKQLVLGNVPLLKSSNSAVTQLLEAYGEGVIDPEKATTINIAGRQRMLSQRMMKEACFLAVGLRTKENGDSLKASMELFNESLINLMQGNAELGIMRPPNPEIEMQLRKVFGLWEAYQTGLSVIEPDSRDSLGALADLADQSDLLLFEMNKAVTMYASLTE